MTCPPPSTTPTSSSITSKSHWTSCLLFNLVNPYFLDLLQSSRKSLHDQWISDPNQLLRRISMSWPRINHKTLLPSQVTNLPRPSRLQEHPLRPLQTSQNLANNHPWFANRAENGHKRYRLISQISTLGIRLPRQKMTPSLLLDLLRVIDSSAPMQLPNLNQHLRHFPCSSAKAF